MTNSDWKQEQTKIAVLNSDEQWQILSFETWDEARDAVNKAREEGKSAVFYDGATLPEVPNLDSLNSDKS